MTCIWHLCSPEVQNKLRSMLEPGWSPPPEDGRVIIQTNSNSEELHLMAIGRFMVQTPQDNYRSAK